MPIFSSWGFSNIILSIGRWRGAFSFYPEFIKFTAGDVDRGEEFCSNYAGLIEFASPLGTKRNTVSAARAEDMTL